MKPLGRVLATFGALVLLLAAVVGIELAAREQRGFSARDPPSAIETHIARAVRSWTIPVRVKALKNPVSATPDVMAEARAHWADHCALCHANDGSGDTPIGTNLYPKAPDMRQRATQSLSDGELYTVIENGVRLTGMPAWGRSGEDDGDTWRLVALIRHLPALTRAEQQQMERMNPKGPVERREETEEEQFLNGNDVPTNK